jgi:hypothetical protein
MKTLATMVFLAVLAAATLLALSPVLSGGFLIVSFDDDAFILDNPYIREFTAEHAWACITRFYHRDYLPLPMLSYLVEFQMWGVQPAGYHLTNLLLHVVNAMLVYAVSARALQAAPAAMFAALVFALHPVQLEAVAVIAQRKTLLATGFVLGALWAYQAYRAGRRRWYAAAVLLYLCACAAKSSAAPFPFLLLLYDYTFDRSRLHIRDKVPFMLLAVATVWLSVASKAGTDVVKVVHGGSYLATGLVMSRVMWEYLAAMLVPLNLSPSYYYSPRSVFGFINWAAAVALVVGAALLLAWRRRFALTFFFVGWAGISLLPVANIVPIAVLRADRYLYLPMIGFAVWAGSGMARVAVGAAASGGIRRGAALMPYATIALLGVLSWHYAFVWHDDVSAWARVVARHQWNARAHYLLAVAYAQREVLEPARRHAAVSLDIDPAFDRPRALLAELDRRLADAPAVEKKGGSRGTSEPPAAGDAGGRGGR